MALSAKTTYTTVSVSMTIDAPVLIDYAATDKTILGLAAQHIGPVNVLSPVLREVDELDESSCESLGIHIVEPTFAQLSQANQMVGRLSLEDALCLVVARESGWTCVTNDKPLRRACENAEVRVLWGLEIMVELVRLRQLSSTEALKVA